MRKILFLLAVAIPLATAFNCAELKGENRSICKYIEKTDWPQSDKDLIIQDMIQSQASLNGNFKSILDDQIEVVELNEIETIQISEENKKFLVDFSSFSLFGYVIYYFLKNERMRNN